jgi:transposase
MHIDHKAGDKVYVDYAGEKLYFVNPQTGEIIYVEVFLAILWASQLTYVEATMTQQKEDFIASCQLERKIQILSIFQRFNCMY